ncbi:MAG TPA: glycosyltransferase family 4 protein [Flavobacterium sp.]
MKKIIRTATVSMSLDILLKGQLAFLNEHYEVIAVSGGDNHLKTVASRENVRIVDLAMSRSISPFKDLVSLVKLYFLFRKEKPLMVHSITPKAGLLSMIAAYFAGVPVRIHTFTGLIFPYKKGFLHHLLLFMDKLLCRFSTDIFPEGEGVKNDLIRFKVTSKPLHVIANGNVNGIDVDYFNPNQISETQKQSLRCELAINPSDFVFLFVGRLVADKGINELISAFTVLSATNKDCKLLLVGPLEKERDPLEKITLNKIETNKNIISVGFQDDIRPYLSISDVFVFPSYREGFPNVVLQAGAMELPCIVSDICGSNEIIKQDVNGIIIPVKNSELLLEKMKLLISDVSLRTSLKQNARQLVVAQYEQQMVWNALLAEYNKLASRV